MSGPTVWVDGALVAADAARISPFDHGLLVGDGVFETLRVYDGVPFAWRNQPTGDAAPARPRDGLVLVDTSASQAGMPLKQARHSLSELALRLSPSDRISVWSLSTPDSTRSLTRGRGRVTCVGASEMGGASVMGEVSAANPCAR